MKRRTTKKTRRKNMVLKMRKRKMLMKRVKRL
jgi:hypothetical protein